MKNSYLSEDSLKILGLSLKIFGLKHPLRAGLMTGKRMISKRM